MSSFLFEHFNKQFILAFFQFIYFQKKKLNRKKIKLEFFN